MPSSFSWNLASLLALRVLRSVGALSRVSLALAGLAVIPAAVSRRLPSRRPAGDALKDLRGRRDLGLGRLQDRVHALSRPGRERRAEVAVVGIMGGDSQALPVREPHGKGSVGSCHLLDPRGHLAGRLAHSRGELVALGIGGGLGFGRAQRRVVLAGVAAAQFGIGGHGQVALGAGSGIPFGPVGHGGGEHLLALPVGLVQRLVAARQVALAGSVVVVAALAGGAGFGGGAQAGQAGIPGGGRTWRSSSPTYGGAQAVSVG